MTGKEEGEEGREEKEQEKTKEEEIYTWMEENTEKRKSVRFRRRRRKT